MQSYVPLLLWASGVVTTLSVVLTIVQTRKLKNETTRSKAIQQDLKAYKDKYAKVHDIIDGSTKYAVWNWGGWHHPSKPQKTWTITVRMKAVESSVTKPGLYRFEFVSHTSQESKDSWTTEQYQDFFERRYGGWLDTNNLTGFHWTTALDPQVNRALRIDSLGITSDDETPSK
jgi:hypothetical protein